MSPARPSRPRVALLLLGWFIVTASLGWLVRQELQVGTDLRLFLPSPRSAEERLVLEGIGEGPASRLLLIGLSGDSPDALSSASSALTDALNSDPDFQFATNGEVNLDELPEQLMDYRYLLSSTLDESSFDEAFLSAQLTERARDLSSPAAGFLEPWLPHDPSLELLKVAESWRPPREPNTYQGVWFDAIGATALLVASTRATGFDPDGQREALDALNEHFLAVRTSPGQAIEISGPGAFSVLMKDRTQHEAQQIGTLATAGLTLLLLVAYRSVPMLFLAALPLLSAGVAALAAVSTVFGTVHGITLAFGFTLIGVAQDYPMHLFSHQQVGRNPIQVVRSLWPTLATGLLSTCVGYLAFLFSGVKGLAQLSVFTITGLAVAGLTTRYLLPHLLPQQRPDLAESSTLGRLWTAINGLPRWRWIAITTTLVCIAVIASSPGPFWSNDLGALTPVPRALIMRDAAMRQELGAPDIRNLLVIQGPTDEAVLATAEALDWSLSDLVDRGALDGFDHAARYLPSVATQSRRQGHLPPPAALSAALNTALASSPFRADTFLPFLKDVEQARSLPALRVFDLTDTALRSRVSSLLLEGDEGWTGLVTLSGIHNKHAVEELAQRYDSVVLLDLKQASEGLIVHQRERILWCLAASALMLITVVRVALGDWHRVRRVVAPMALTTLVILAILRLADMPLNLFHLISLVLAAGLGLDYALFFERAADDTKEQRRTLHAVLVCSMSTLMVFALLAFSTLPVLQAIGVTVAIGVAFNFILSMLMTRPASVAAGFHD